MPSLRPIAVAACLALLLAVTAPAAARTVWYAGDDPDGRTLLLELDVDPDTGDATGRVLTAPPTDGERAGVALSFAGTTHAGEQVRLEVAAPAPNGDDVALVVDADAAHDADGPHPPPSAYGAARLEVGPIGDVAGWTASLAAIGTRYAVEAGLDDGSYELASSSPFFYVDPWRTLSLHTDPVRTAEALVAGLTMRSERPTGATSQGFEVRRTEIAGFSERLVSARTVVDAYAGGAHPNRSYDVVNVVRDGDAWREVDVCGALNVLDRPCGEAALRSRVADELRTQEAAWLESGEVDASTPWLLDGFTVEPAGLRFDFAPYEVGPYADGPYAVTVPFDELP